MELKTVAGKGGTWIWTVDVERELGSRSAKMSKIKIGYTTTVFMENAQGF